MNEIKLKAREFIRGLASKYMRDQAQYKTEAFNETRARTEFITPMLEAFGWDVRNAHGMSSFERDVIEEAHLDMPDSASSRRPDYELRVDGERQLFIEAKKPSVELIENKTAAFQTRRYGFSGGTLISVLTNFETTVVYDCRTAPNPDDPASTARIFRCSVAEYESRFDELWAMLSKPSVSDGYWQQKLGNNEMLRGHEAFDNFFFEQLCSWRLDLTRSIRRHLPNLSDEDLSATALCYILRLVFLRICEDREIEKYADLLKVAQAKKNNYARLMKRIEAADDFYDSGLFMTQYDKAVGISVENEVIKRIIQALYYPESPYTFAVVEADVLGRIYERFLGSVLITRQDSLEVEVSEEWKPEVRESGGVVTTPRNIVDLITKRILDVALENKTPNDLQDFTVADICCGSGIFLLASYDALLRFYLEWYSTNEPDEALQRGQIVRDKVSNDWRLSFEERRRILTQHIRGIDIDANAVEVAKFSLHLKLLERQNLHDIATYCHESGQKALPNLDHTVKAGNSLVSEKEWEEALGAPMPLGVAEVVNPFDWYREFPQQMKNGFSVILGNPPYVRIQHLKKYAPEEAAFFQSNRAPYVSSSGGKSFDKYQLFIERSLKLTAPSGRVGLIVPNKLFSVRTAMPLRELLQTRSAIERIEDFGALCVFAPVSQVYSCVLILSHAINDSFIYRIVKSQSEIKKLDNDPCQQIPIASLNTSGWRFVDDNVRNIFDRVLASGNTVLLKDVAEIMTGLQTSADKIYILPRNEKDPEHPYALISGNLERLEDGIARPCLYDVPLTNMAEPEPNAWMIFPYRIKKDDQGRKTACVIEEDELIANYPRTWAYFCEHREALLKRNISGGSKKEHVSFYQFGRSQNLTRMNEPKLIIPGLSRSARYAYDPHGLLITGGSNGPYNALRSVRSETPNLYLLAVLSHPLCEAMVRTLTSVFRGGWYSHSKQFIQNLPIPIPSDEVRDVIVRQVKDAIETNRKLAQALRPSEKTKQERHLRSIELGIEEKISELYGLSKEELELLKNVQPPAS